MVRNHFITLAAFCVLTAHPCLAVDKEWNFAGNGTWNSAINWSPNGVPLSTDVVYLGRAPFPQGFLTTLDVNATVAGFTMRNGSDFDTNGFQLLVNGLTTVAGTGSVFTIDPKTTADFDGLDTQGLLIENSGLVSMNGGILELESGALDIMTGGVSGSGGLGGFGTIELIESGTGSTQVFNNSGRLYVGKTPFAIGGTLTITNTDTNDLGTVGDGTVDLDGDSETGVVDVDDDPLGQVSNLTLVVDAALDDSFSGEMQIGRGDAVDMRRAWTINGDLQLNGSTGTATLRGANVTAISGANINVNSGIGAIESNLTVTGGTINVATGTTLRLDGTTNINSATALLLNGSAALHVTGETTIDDSAGDFNWDGGGSTVTRVSSNGLLQLNLDHIDTGDDLFDGQIDLEDDGDLDVTVSNGAWQIVAGGSLNKNNAGLSTVAGSRLAVDGGVIDVNAGTLEFESELDLGFGGTLSVEAGAQAQINGAIEFLPGSLTLVNGGMNLAAPTVWNQPALVGGSGTIVNHASSTFLGSTTISVAVFDWDQGSTDIEPGASATLNVGRIDLADDTFDGETIAVKSGQLTVNVADDAWALGAGALLRLNNTNGTAPALNGDRVVLAGGEIRVLNGDADINAPMTVESGSQILIQDPLTLQLHGPTTLQGGTINEATGVDSTVGQFGALTVTGNSSINVNTYNWDQAATTVEAGGSLTLNVGALDVQPGERHDHNIALNSGDLTVNNSAGAWTTDDELKLNNSTGVAPGVFGASLNVGDGVGALDADLLARGTGVSELNVAVSYRSDADVDVSSAAILRHNGSAYFNGSGEFTGSGTLDFADDVTIGGTTTFDMPNGTIDLDGPVNDLSGDIVLVMAPWTINANTVAPFGKNNVTGDNILAVDNILGGTLTVNLTDPAGTWQVQSPGELMLTAGLAPATVLAGSDLDMDGKLTVTGDVRTTARVLIGGTASIVTPGEAFRLEGGSLANPNRIEGGAISGPGTLMSTAGHALHGFGTINANIDFAGNAELKARDGQLHVTSTVIDVGELGTSDVDGILNMSNAWNTNVATQVRMAGGEIRGANITNDSANGIRGFGTVTARAINNSVLMADGGTLVIDNAASDYDGAGAGVLDATAGNLEIRDNAPFAFSGTARVGNSHTAQINGFRMNFNAGSTMQLNAAAWQAPSGLNLAGTLNVSGGNASFIDSIVDVTFVNGSSTTLTGNLQLNANPAIIQSGATFTGGGDLLNLGASALRLNNGAVVGVGIQNEGFLELGNAATVRVDAADFIQTNTGTMDINLAGTGINQYDRFVLSGAAQLSGQIAVSLLSGFVPTLGDSFTVISASGGVTGAFDMETLPTLGSGLALNVVYNPTSVLLEVIQSLSPDFDMDGNVDGEDVDLLVMEIVAMNNGPLFDLTGDGQVNTADLTEWLALAGQINLPSGNSYTYGDANLDGFVDGSDFGIWNANKFTMASRWTLGDFSADGSIDGSDFGVWNSHKYTSADGGTALVPEPGGILMTLLGVALLALGKARSRNVG